MNDQLTIYIDRLQDGKIEEISTQASCDFIDVYEHDLEFKDPIEVTGSVYLTQDHLVSHLSIKTQLYMPCAICNQSSPISIEVKNLYTTEPLETIHSGLFDLRTMIREALLLEVPGFYECSEGNCPERTIFAKFLKQSEKEVSAKVQPKSYLPFADLE